MEEKIKKKKIPREKKKKNNKTGDSTQQNREKKPERGTQKQTKNTISQAKEKKKDKR